MAKAIKKVLGIDFETASRKRESACSVGLYLKEFHKDNVIFEKEILIDPKCEFEYFNMLINGITPEMVKGCDEFKEIYPVIAGLIDAETVIVAHNASFDMSVLRNCCDKYGLDYPEAKYICTLLLSRALVPHLPSYELDKVAKHLGIEDFQHHHALEDAKTCVKIFEILMEECKAVSLYQLAKVSGVRFGYLEKAKYKPCRKRQEATVCIEGEDFEEKDPYEDDTFEVDDHNPIYGKTVVFTGALCGMSRQEAEEEVRRHGGIAGKTVNKSTNYLVFGYQDPKVLKGKEKSTKMIKAEKMVCEGVDIQVVNEAEFYRMLDE